MIVGIPACAKTISRHAVPPDAGPLRRKPCSSGVGALPVLIPPLGETMLGLLDTLAGLLVPGSPSNVHPSHYQGGESETPDFHDLERDHTTLPLIRAAIARGLPVLAICRGIQELNVALGRHPDPARPRPAGLAATTEAVPARSRPATARSTRSR